ncbi:hypothetical protein RDI58_017786 [Solanum bulbocastanum]|uniref:Uncharacterized protein n=1 Tax=Solanum bulbocastanum TaxID=147425 RepID=A0AAN8YAB0_SOLBU
MFVSNSDMIYLTDMV